MRNTNRSTAAWRAMWRGLAVEMLKRADGRLQRAGTSDSDAAAQLRALAHADAMDAGILADALGWLEGRRAAEAVMRRAVGLPAVVEGMARIAVVDVGARRWGRLELGAWTWGDAAGMVALALGVVGVVAVSLGWR